MARTVDVLAVYVPSSMMATVWTGVGKDVETGEFVEFAGDWRPMRDLRDACQESMEDGEGMVTVDLEDWQVRRVLADLPG